MYYVYALIDIRSNLPFYIGKGKKGSNRHLHHFNESVESTSNRFKFYKINYLKSCGYDIPVLILKDDIPDENEAYQYESEYITKYGRENIDENGILTNMCIDNRPPSHKNRKQSREHVEKRMNSSKNTIVTNGRKPLSEETRKKIGRSVTGEKNGFYNKTHDIKTRELLSEIMKGNDNRAQYYKFRSPDNKEYVVKGFRSFCLENDLVISTMEKNLRNKTISTYGSCKGWFVEKIINKENVNESRTSK